MSKSVVRQRIISLASGIAILAMLIPYSFAGVQVANAVGVTVSGRIVAPNGSALADEAAQAWIQIDPQAGGPGRGEPTNGYGQFSITGITAGTWTMSINYGGSGAFVGPEPQTFVVGSSSVNLGDIKLTSPQVSGIAYAPNGTTPLSNASVGLSSLDHTVNRWSGTNAQGGFSFGGLRRGTYLLQVSPSPDSGYTQGKMTIELAQDSSVLTGIHLLATTPNVIGTIRKPDGSALTLDMSQGQWISVDLFNADHTVQFNSQSAENGSFAFGGVSAGAYTLEVRATGLPYTNAAPRSVTVGASGVTNIGNVPLTNPKLRGTVTDAQGEPVQNAWVQVHNEDWSFQTGANTNDAGFYSLGGINNGTYLLDIQRPMDRTDLISPDQSSVTITDVLQTKNLQFVAATKFVSGTVTRSAGSGTAWTFGGDPITNAQVNANKEGGNGWANTNVDSQGRYTLALSPGVWNIMVQAPWGQNGPELVDWVYGGMPKQVVFASNSTLEQKTMNLEVVSTDATIRGRVVKPDGTPVTNAGIDIRTQEGTGMNGQVQANGRFTMPVVAGSYKLSVHANDQSLTFPEIGVSVASGQTKDLGTITATTKDAKIIVKAVRENGTGIAGLRVNAFRHNGQGWGNSTTNDDGIAEIAVTDGTWGVNIEAGPGARYVRTNNEPIDIELPESNSVVSYENNDRLEVEMTYADASITGHIVDEDGNVVRGFCAYAFARPNQGGLGDKMMHQEFGGPVDCQQGSFAIYVPTDVAGTYTLGIHSGPNAAWLPTADQDVAVFSDTETKADIVVTAPNARLTGHLKNQNGDNVTSCSGKDGFGGWVDVSKPASGLFFGTELRPDCTYSVNLLSGDGYTLNVWTGQGSQFLERPPSNDTFEVKAGDNARNFQVIESDKTISGRVTDPDGKGVNAFVFAHTKSESNGPPTPEEMDNELFSGTKTDPDGRFELGVISGQWEIGGGLPPDNTDLLPPKFQSVDMTSRDSATVNLELQRALGQMSGRLTASGQNLPFGFVACWDEENGTFSGAEARNGEYALNYAPGTFTCQADSFDGETFYRSEEVQKTFTNQTSVSQDFELSASNYKVPSPVVATFSSSAAQVLKFENGTTVSIPAGALSSTEENVTVTATPTVNLRKNKDTKPFGAGYDFVATDADGQTIAQFNQNVTITFTYDEDMLGEFGIDSEASLSAQFYSEDTSTWQTPTSVSVDTENNQITIQTNHFTTFAVVGSSAQQAVSGAQTIVVGARAGGGPHVTTWNGSGQLQSSFMAYATGFRGGVSPVMADFDGDGAKEIATAPYSAGGPHVRLFSASGSYRGDVYPYGLGYRGGLSITAGNVDDDAAMELIVSPSTGGGPNVRVYDFLDGAFTAKSGFFAYPVGLRTGMSVQTGDTDGDGRDEIVTSTNRGAAPHIRVFDGMGSLEGQFYAFPLGFGGGMNVTVGDVNGDDKADIVATPRTAGGPHVRVFRPDGTVISQFFAYPSSWRMGLKTGVGDVNNDGHVEIVTAPSTDSGPHIRIFTAYGQLLGQFMAYTPDYHGGVEVAVGNVDSDAAAEIVTAPSLNGGPHVRIFNSDYTGPSFMAFTQTFRGGVNLTLSR